MVITNETSPLAFIWGWERGVHVAGKDNTAKQNMFHILLEFLTPHWSFVQGKKPFHNYLSPKSNFNLHIHTKYFLRYFKVL